MVSGLAGMDGDHALKHVIEVQEYDLGHVILPDTMEDPALDKDQNRGHANIVLVLLMVHGVVGVAGVAVVDRAEEEPKLGLGAVRKLDMAEEVVLDPPRSQDLAKRIPVPQVAEANVAFLEYFAVN